ncbi:MAG: gamma carbonic anhydrase family protein [Chloroflexota bacterium]|nr:gamma carbonic anhydrase family protein [Chloroflexota bacterium]
MIRALGEKVPQVAGSAFVSEAAYVVGDVEIGEGSSVWPGAVVRGDFAKIAIGRNTQVEDNSVLHSGIPMTIGDNVHIGHGAVVHCRSVGSNVLVGNNAVLLDGAEVGNDCLICAGAVVAQGMKVPDRSFVAGVPGEIKKQVTEEHLARIESGVRTYVELAREYRRQGL